MKSSTKKRRSRGRIDIHMKQVHQEKTSAHLQRHFKYKYLSTPDSNLHRKNINQKHLFITRCLNQKARLKHPRLQSLQFSYLSLILKSCLLLKTKNPTTQTCSNPAIPANNNPIFFPGLISFFRRRDGGGGGGWWS